VEVGEGGEALEVPEGSDPAAGSRLEACEVPAGVLSGDAAQEGLSRQCSEMPAEPMVLLRLFWATVRSVLARECAR
jgi:hypothetical protein